MSAVLESLVLFVQRMSHAPQDVVALLLHGAGEVQTAEVDTDIKAFLKDQITRTWEEVSSGRLKVRGRDAGDYLARTFSSLYKISAGR